MIGPDNLWLPHSDWRQHGKCIHGVAPWIRASWRSDAWTTGPNEGGKSIHYVRADRLEKLREALEHARTKFKAIADGGINPGFVRGYATGCIDWVDDQLKEVSES